MQAAQRRSFWKLLRLVRRIGFELRKRVLQGSESYVAANTAGRILTELIWITLPSMLFAIGTATALLISDLYLPAVINWRWAPIPLWRLEDRESYATLLSTISGIGGVLIGLYYAGMTAVSSAAYAQAPGVLRNLLLRQPVGKLYIRLLAYATFVSLCLLAFYGIGFSPVRLAIPFLVLLSGVTILSFVHLGQQAFYFFDPTRLADSIFADLHRWVTRATVAGRSWEDSSFQSHANQRADATLKALTTLADYASLNKHLRSDAIAGLATSTVGFLYRYESARQLIPSESKWYPTDYQHPDFYTAGDLKIQFAVNSGSSVQPVTISQADWVEDAAIPVVLKALQANLDEKSEASLFRVLDALRVYIEHLGGLWEIEPAVAICQRIANLIAPVAFSAESAASDSPRWRLGLVEHLCLLPITALLGFVKSLENVKLARIRDLVGKVRWEKPESLYRAGFPRFVLPRLEWFRPRLEFELMAEGKIITPQWLIEQGVIKDYLIALHKAMDLLLRANERSYGAWHKKSVEAKHPWAAAIVLNRQDEYLRKLQTHFEKIAAIETEYESAKVLQDLLGWPSKQTETFKQRIVAIHHAHEIATAREALNLVGVERPSHVPDFSGEFLSRTAQTAVEAICQKDVTVFEAVFPFFFETSIKKTGDLLRLANGRSHAEQISWVNLAMGPLLDLVELSGHSILLSELRQSPEPWNSVKALWDRYLLDETAGPPRMHFLKGALQTADIPGMSVPGELLRSGWRMWIHQLLRDVPVVDVVSGSFGIHVDQRVQHPSALIRVLARRTFAGFYRGIDVFAATYFVQLAGNEAAADVLRSSDLIDALERESREEEGEEGGGRD
jgi:hypothetical protein